MRTPNLNALRMFDASARHLNFRRAAAELNLTQGAVAQQVRGLEADLGVKLFERQARGLSLTTQGREYHASVGRALGLIYQATQKLAPTPEQIRLSVTPSFATKWLVPRLPKFTAAHPDIDIQTEASEGLADLRSDGVDLAIRYGRPPFGENLDYEFLAPLGLSAVCSPELADKISPISDVDDFASHQLIEDGHSLWRQLLDQGDGQRRLRIMKFNQTALAMDAAANGQGITLAPYLLIEAEVARGELVVVWQDTRDNDRGYYLVWRERPSQTAALKAVMDWVVSEIT